MVAEALDMDVYSQVDEILHKYEGEPGCLIQVLHETQQKIGYLPEEVQEYVAKGLDIRLAEVNGVVSFYSFFSTVPRGKHVVRVCLGTACYVRGGRRVLDAMKQNLGIDVGQTTPDRQFTLEVARCFGACGLAPAVMIDEEVHQRVKPNKLNDLLAPYRAGGTT